MATNAEVDTLASAISAPYGPLVRQTNMSDLPTPNGDIKILFETAVSGVTLYMTYNELANEDVADAIIAQAFNFQKKIDDFQTDLDTYNTAVQALALPHTYTDFKETVYDGFVELARNYGFINS